MARSLNRVQLIGNLTRDPELRYTPSGTAVTSFSIATNRSWTTDQGEKHEETDFHRIVAWNKLAELCSQFLTKGRKVYVEGRLTTRNWTGQDGQQKSTTEVVIDDMILLDNKGGARSDDMSEGRSQASHADERPAQAHTEKKPAKTQEKTETEVMDEPMSEDIAPDDIPF